MAKWKNILVERSGSLGKITLNRPDARNSLDALAYEGEKQINEHREKIPVSDLSTAERAIEAARETLANEQAPAEEISQKRQELETALHKISETLYKQDQQAGAQPPGADEAAGAESDEGDVVDAEFTEEGS